MESVWPLDVPLRGRGRGRPRTGARRIEGARIAAAGRESEAPGPTTAAGSWAIATKVPDEGMRAMSDRDAVARAREGDQEAFRVLVERYQGRAHRLALRVLRDEEQARDAVQDAFLKVHSNLGRFENRSSFYTWLYRLVMNVCLDAKRRDRSSRFVDTPELGDLERVATHESMPASEQHWRVHEEAPDDALDRTELRDAVARAITALARRRARDADPARGRGPQLLRDRRGARHSEGNRDEPTSLRPAPRAGAPARGGYGRPIRSRAAQRGRRRRRRCGRRRA